MKMIEPGLSIGLVAVLTTLSSSLLAVDAVDVQHRVIHYEEGKHCGMPAFHGANRQNDPTDVLVRLPSMTTSPVADSLPICWKSRRPQS